MNATRRKAAWALAGMALAAGAALAARPRVRVNLIGPSLDLKAEVPTRLGSWSLDPSILPLQPDPQLQKVIDETYEQTLGRTYRRPDGYRIMLSMAYGGRQDRSMQTHRPEVCYPAQGLSVRKSTFDAHVDLPERQLPLKRMVAGNGPRNEPISYWLVIGDSLSEFGYSHRLATLRYGLTGRIPDGMLVRVSSVDDDEARAFAKQEEFLVEFFSALSPDFRKRLLGVL
jgi:EpsI family protein